MLSLVSGAILFVSFIVIISFVQRNQSSGLSKVPNAHFSVPWSRLWIRTVRWLRCENRTRLALHRKLGPVIRISPRELSIDCIDGGVRLIYGREFAKDDWYANTFFGNDMPFMFAMKSKEDHAERKRMLAGVYSKSAIMSSNSLDGCISAVLDCLQDSLGVWADGTAVDVLDQTKACLMDITTAWIYGVANRTDFLRDQASRADFFKFFEQIGPGFFWRSEFPLCTKLLRGIGIDIDPPVSVPSQQELLYWGERMATRAFEEKETTPSVYTHFRDNFQKANPEMTPEDAQEVISAELFDHVIASHDVGGIVLTWAMYELSRHPEAQQALRTELHTLSGPSEMASAQRIDQLPILEATVKETLRLRSANPGPWPRVVPAAGCRLADRFDVPPGTVVSATSWTLHRNPMVFPLPEEWKPERWLTADDAAKREMKKWFWAFGSGARMCIGSHFGMRAIKAILVAIYANYETILAGDLDVEQVDGILAGPVGNRLYLKFRRCT